MSDSSDQDLDLMDEEVKHCHKGHPERVSKINDLNHISCDQLIQLNQHVLVTCLETENALTRKAEARGLVVVVNDIKESNNKKRKRKRFSYSIFSHRKRKLSKNVAEMEREDSRRQYWAESINEVKLNYEYELLYNVKWEGYDARENTWQSVDDLEECHLLFEHFFRQQFTSSDDVIYYTYDDLHALKRCLCETVGVNSDICLLLKLNRLELSQFDRSSDKQIRQLKTNLDKYSEALRRICRRKPSADLWSERILIQHVIRHLDINTIFGNLEKMFEFYEKRKEINLELIKWSEEVNEQIQRNENSRESYILCENLVDLEIPPKLEYIDKYSMHSDVRIESTRLHRVTCQCLDDCTRNRSCVCALKIYKDNRRFKSSNVLYECTELCACNESCPNRRVQKGRVTSALTVFRTESRGWGVMTRERIEYKAFIMEYIGEVISSVQTIARDPTYFFNIDAEFCGQTLFIDGKEKGNITRFANHCCEPNMDLHLAVVDNQHLVPRIAFFANRTIRAFEELTYDYKRSTLSTDRYGNYVNKNTTTATTGDSHLATDTASQDSGYASSQSSRDDRQQRRRVRTTTSNDIECFCGKPKCKGFI